MASAIPLALARAALAVLCLAAPARASDWNVVAAKSWLGFTGTAAGAPFDGQFSRWQARIDFDPANAEHGHAVVIVDMTSAVTGDGQKDQALPQAGWFDTKAFPKATLAIQSFGPKGGHDYEAVGTLTMRNVTKAIVMPLTIETNGNTLHAIGHLDIVRTDYGVGQGTSVQWVALEVVAAFDVTAERLP